MRLNTKIAVTVCLFSGVVLLASMTAVQQPLQAPQQETKYVNLKVLPKHITHAQLGAVMNTWRRSLGVQCGFCHARNADNTQTDYASDAKPEKLMARKMFTMAAKINSKYFDTKKDSTGMMALSSVSCNTCHRGATHPEVALAAQPPRQGGQGGQGGQRPAGQGGQGGQGNPPATTPPPHTTF